MSIQENAVLKQAPHPRPRLADNIKSWRWWFGMASTTIAHPSPQPQQRLSVTVVVPAYNEEASIAQTVKSILAQTYAVDEIIVVDDCSPDNTGDVARSFGVRVVRTAQNQGTKAQAQNYVLNQITTDIFITIDGDTMLAPDAIEAMMPFFADPSTASVCGFVIPQRIESFWEYGRFGEYLYGLTMYKPAQNHSGLVTVSSGCFSAYRTHVVTGFGGFWSRTLVEDMDLTWAAHQQGYRIYFTPKAKCYPVEPPTAKIYFRQIERWQRGFLQVIQARGFNLFPLGVGFALYVYFNLVWGVLSIVALPMIFWRVVGSMGTSILLSLASELAFIGIFAIWRGRQFGMTQKAILSVIPTLCMQYTNRIILLYSIFLEWVCGKKLTTWHKGH